MNKKMNYLDFNYDAVACYDAEYKSLALSTAQIDEGIRELADAINQCKCLVTINSCQGFLIENEKSKHCPIAYVDFFVLEHCYTVVEALFMLLVEEFRSCIICKMEYQADFDIIDDPGGEIAEDNGYVIPRYHIEFEELKDNLHELMYQEVVELIKAYVISVNKWYELEYPDFFEENEEDHMASL
ncbi:hypothetical protein GH808_02970 [Acetobacterium fimetarium]|uniref:Uncharacterized protein n=1 Tax=Acetobacterium fimetarium TaxID=52691 RepID=A0ABR6WSX1_9FIRM|nr:hypothetical protein [Acetobacterium fimetarium]MBC3803399.1 hypothetical protein [Acetobacterium fimetarium]